MLCCRLLQWEWLQCLPLSALELHTAMPLWLHLLLLHLPLLHLPLLHLPLLHLLLRLSDLALWARSVPLCMICTMQMILMLPVLQTMPLGATLAA